MRHIILIFFLIQTYNLVGQEFEESKHHLVTKIDGLKYTYVFEDTHHSFRYEIKLVTDTFLCSRFHTPPDYSFNGPSHLASYLLSDLKCPYDYINDKSIPVNGMFRAEFKIDSVGKPTNLVFKVSPHPDIGKGGLRTSLAYKMKQLKKLSPAYYKDKELETKFIILANFECP